MSRSSRSEPFGSHTHPGVPLDASDGGVPFGGREERDAAGGGSGGHGGRVDSPHEATVETPHRQLACVEGAPRHATAERMNEVKRVIE